jgi:hypothetical protein
MAYEIEHTGKTSKVSQKQRRSPKKNSLSSSTVQRATPKKRKEVSVEQSENHDSQQPFPVIEI